MCGLACAGSDSGSSFTSTWETWPDGPSGLASGWQVVEETRVDFTRPQGHLPLPVPSHDGSIELLRPFVNVDGSDFHLLIAWMVAALRPVGPFPVLVIRGDQGSAKSTLAKVIRQLIDPQIGPASGRAAQHADDLMVTAVNGWLLAYDNLGVLSSGLSDSLCRLATGGGISKAGTVTPTRKAQFHLWPAAYRPEWNRRVRAQR